MSSAKRSADEPSGAAVDRRRFLVRVSIALSAAGAALVGVPFVGFLIAPLLERAPRLWRPVGRVADFTIGNTVEVSFEDASSLPWAGVTGRTAAWLRRHSADEFIAFAVNCTHLGCPVRWLPDADLFMCPCHGGVYYSDGRVASGPPPQALTRYPVRVRNGRVEIQTSPVPIT
jgi:quinol---cytochrome c reductase iron-sulfur subunit, bacillus type